MKLGSKFRQCRMRNDRKRQGRLHAAANAFPQERSAFNDGNKSINFFIVRLIRAMLVNGSSYCQRGRPFGSIGRCVTAELIDAATGYGAVKP